MHLLNKLSGIVTHSLPLNEQIEVHEYLLENGKSPYKKWFDGIGEFVLNTGPGYRIYLGKDGPTLIVLLGGGTKHRQQKDIDQAKALFADYKARKKNNRS
jgi:putative addiction module killer protein